MKARHIVPFVPNFVPFSGEVTTILFITVNAFYGLRQTYSALNIPFECEQKEKFQITKSPPVLHRHENIAELWIISAIVASNWSQIRFFILANVTLHGKTGKKVMTRARYFNTLDKRKFL